MKKNKIILAEPVVDVRAPIMLPEIPRASKAPKGIKATGTFVVVEMLSKNEASGSRLFQPGKSEQGIIRDIGPALEKDKWGIKVGDRVLMQGTSVPVPSLGDGREYHVVDTHTIKCILLEE